MQVVTGNFGDHGLLIKLLEQVRRGAAAEDFFSRLDRPGYDAGDRLLLMHRNNIVGHVHLVNQTAWFHGVRVPLVELQDIVVLPEYRSGPGESELLAQAEICAAQEGAVLTTSCTDSCGALLQRGWRRWRHQGFSRADTGALLSHVDTGPARRRRFRQRGKLEVRTWRHIELDGIRSVYDRVAVGMWGCENRCEKQWQWLMGRKVIDSVLIAVDPRSQEDSDELPNGIVGYAAVRDWRILEMFTLPEHPSAARILTARACRDAIDRNHHFVSLHAPASDPMHEMVVTAGGTWVVPRAGQDCSWAYRLLSPGRWVERLYDLLLERTRAAGVARPVSLTLAEGDQLQSVLITRRSCRLEEGGDPESALRCRPGDVDDLLVGNLPSDSPCRRESPLEAAHLASVLFPPTIFWQSSLELQRL